jgi:zinc protease
MKIGFHTVPLSHQDLYPLDVLAIILGKGRTSRLYQELKDNEDLVLSVDASSWTPSYASGLFILSFSLDRKNVESTLASVWEEIGRLKKDLVKKRELEKAKRQVVADFVFSKQSASGMASSLASSFAATGDPYFDNKYVDRIREVSRKDIQRVARTYLRRQARTVSIVSPPGALEESGEANVRETAGEIKKVTLENGLTLLLKRNPSVPIVAFKLFGHGGQRFELKGPDGISSFTMELLTKGTKSRTKRDIAETIEGLGGTLDSGSGRNAYYVSLAVLKDDLKIGLELLADVLQNPSFPQEEIEKQRQDTLLTIRRLDENWQNEVERIFRRHYYEHHPYGNDVIGSEEGIRQLNRNEIVEFYHRMVMPNNAVLAVFGDIEPEKTVAEITSSLGGWRPGKPLKPIIPTITTPLTADEQVRQETEKVSAAIYVGTNGLTLNDPDKPTLDVIDAVLSGIGYPSGWLHEALRGGDRSLVYVIHAFPSSGLKGGHFGVITQTTMANYPKVVDIILEKLAKIQQQPLQSKELEAAKDMVITMHELSTETIGAQARSAALNELLGLGYDWGERYPEIIQQVSTADVLRVARRLFRHHLLVSTIPEKPVEAIIPPEQKQRMHAQ